MTAAHILWCRDDNLPPSPPLAAALPRAEQQELAQLVHPERQRSFILSRHLLRNALATHLDIPADEIRFRRDAKGRLQLENVASCCFSLSHCPGHIALILADAGCGVDVELPRQLDTMRLARRYFSAAELDWLEACDTTRRQQDFFRLWTLKEATVKALGQGLAHNLARLAFALDSAGPRLLTAAPALRLWQGSAGECVLAAAVATTDAVLWECHEIDGTSLG